MKQGEGAGSAEDEEEDVFHEAEDELSEEAVVDGAAVVEDEVVAVMDYDRDDKPDPADIYAKTAQVKVDFNRAKPAFFFIQLEMLLESSGCTSQWMKRLVLQRQLPQDVVEDLEDIFSKGKTAAGATAYIDAKLRILHLYAPKPQDKWKIAKELMLTDKPSQLARKLIQALCPKHPTLEDCCVEPVISGMWRDQLPAMVKAAVANMSLAGGSMETTLNHADEVYASMKSGGAAVSAVAEEEVAAVKQSRTKQKGKPPQKKKGKKKTEDGPPPPEGCCQVHRDFGKSAYFCKMPWSCPWAQFTCPPKNTKNN